MGDQQKNIDDLFRDKLGDYTEQPDPSAWSDVEQKLDKKDIGGGGGSSGYNPAGIILLAVVGIALFFTAKWAIGHLAKHTSSQANNIAVINENKLPVNRQVQQNVANTTSQPTKTNIPVKENGGAVEPSGSVASGGKNNKENIPDSDQSQRTAKDKLVTSVAKSKVPGPVISNRHSKHSWTNISRRKNKQQNADANVVGLASQPKLTEAKRTGSTVATAQRPVVGPTPDASRSAIPIAKNEDNVKTAKHDLNENKASTEKAAANEQPLTIPAPGVTQLVQGNVKTSEPLIEAKSPVMIEAVADKKTLNDTAMAATAPIDIPKLIKGKKGLGSLQGGLKVGFEGGLSNNAAAKIVLSPYLQYNMSKTLAFLTQPAVKVNFLTQALSGSSQSYYNITNSSVTSAHIVKKSTDSLSVDTIRRRYYYSQTHDSIVVGYKAAKKTYVEFELPVLLQYKISKKWSVYGGVNFNFSKTVKVTEDTRQFTGIVRKDSVLYNPVPVSTPEPTPPAINDLFQYTGRVYALSNSGSANVTYINPDTDPVKVGYTLGFSYSPKPKWLIDLLMQQMLSSPAYIPNSDVRQIYKQPYFRLTIGYRFFKIGK